MLWSLCSLKSSHSILSLSLKFNYLEIEALPYSCDWAASQIQPWQHYAGLWLPCQNLRRFACKTTYLLLSMIRLRKNQRNTKRWCVRRGSHSLTVNNVVDLKAGTAGHLFFGHGPNQEQFERRDFGTTNQMFYDKKMKADTLVNPHFFNSKRPSPTFGNELSWW